MQVLCGCNIIFLGLYSVALIFYNYSISRLFWLLVELKNVQLLKFAGDLACHLVLQCELLLNKHLKSCFKALKLSLSPVEVGTILEPLRNTTNNNNSI